VLNSGLSFGLKPELASRVNAVLTAVLRTEFCPEFTSRLEPGFTAEV
jgi:hypothetical protein